MDNTSLEKMVMAAFDEFHQEISLLNAFHRKYHGVFGRTKHFRKSERLKNLIKKLVLSICEGMRSIKTDNIEHNRNIYMKKLNDCVEVRLYVGVTFTDFLSLLSIGHYLPMLTLLIAILARIQTVLSSLESGFQKSLGLNLPKSERKPESKKENIYKGKGAEEICERKIDQDLGFLAVSQDMGEEIARPCKKKKKKKKVVKRKNVDKAENEEKPYARKTNQVFQFMVESKDMGEEIEMPCKMKKKNVLINKNVYKKSEKKKLGKRKIDQAFGFMVENMGEEIARPGKEKKEG
jgi:hypothetical protein